MTDLDDWRRDLEEPPIGGEVLDSQCGRHDDELQRSAALVAQRHDPRQEADQDVRVDAALVSLVYDDDAVLVQQEILANGEGTRR